MSRVLRAALGCLALAALPWPAAAQGYRLRLDSRFQTVDFRGVSPDSIARTDVVTGPNGELGTADGFAVTCPPSSDICVFYRPGPTRTSAPLVNTADVTIWGLGVPGLSVRGNARWATDLKSGEFLPGTQPELQLLEAYAEYTSTALTGRVGRQHVTGRLGWTGIDGAALTLRSARFGLELSGYGGWGLARGVELPITSPAVNPLDEFQLTERHVTAGAALGWRRRGAEFRAEYQREIDRSVDYFISERAALTAVLRPVERVSITGGADYDLGQGWWGTSDLTLRYDGARVSADGGVRRYRPYFPLWTIWGAFSPTPYTAVDGSLAVSPVRRLRVRAWGERYWYDNTGAETALARFEDRGWRLGFSGTAQITPALAVDGGYHQEFGPGASSDGWDGRVTWLPTPAATVSAFASTMTRPLEFRFDEAQLDAVGLDASWRATERLTLGLSGAQYFESRRRPDAGAFDWNQFRVQARITWLFGSDADQLRLPRAIRGATRRTAP